MSILLDTNILLDHLLARVPWVTDATIIWQAVDAGRLGGFITATTLTDIHFIARRLTDRQRAMSAVRICLEAFQILPVDGSILTEAANLGGSDFEDNVQIACATRAGLNAIVTRDPASFRDAPMPVLSPAQIVERLRR